MPSNGSKMNENIIQNILNQYFSNFRDYHLLIIVLLIIINFTNTLYIVKKIEKFKFKLKKNEITFSIYNKLQIESLRTIFHLLTIFKEETKRIRDAGADNPEYSKKKLDKWIDVYNKLRTTFSKEKYILPTGLKEEYTSTLSTFISLKNMLSTKREWYSYLYTDEVGDIEQGGDPEDFAELSNQLNAFDENKMFQQSISKIDKLRTEIENYCEQIEIGVRAKKVN